MAGLSLRAIAEKMGTSATTVRRWVRRWQREGNICSKKTRSKFSLKLPSRMLFDPFKPNLFTLMTPLQYTFFKLNMQEYTLIGIVGSSRDPEGSSRTRPMMEQHVINMADPTSSPAVYKHRQQSTKASVFQCSYF
ncbi:hypothetical protein Pcinc_003123 [Petrolisthes cinctipes]|uniref:Uncharacterized protein n=1 Tax=Petrolisthes cinctipes TaxID=88211 RepID=A0AAE1GJH7_PETCI|nr:hypothetical protein Pcinc_003123 [Petrolisthes cinctipes]